jgi:hypothetical protein
MCGISAYFDLQQKKHATNGSTSDTNHGNRNTAAKLDGKPERGYSSHITVGSQQQH